MESEQGLRAYAELSLDCGAWTCGHDFLLLCSFRICQPHHSSLFRVDQLSRKLLWLVRPLQHALECKSLFPAVYHEDNLSRIVQHRRRQRDSIRIKLPHPIA